MFQFNPPSSNLFPTQPTMSNATKPFSFCFGNTASQTNTLQFNTPAAAPSFGFPNPTQPIISSVPNVLFPQQTPQFQTGQPLNTLASQNISKDSLIQQLYMSFSSPAIFNDVRDQILQQWNQFQALAGKGKGYYNPQLPPIEYNIDGIVAKLKTICYNNIVEEKNEDGVMIFLSNKPYDEIIKVKTELADGINRILGNKPNVVVEIMNVRKMADGQRCCLTLVVVEKLPQGVTRKISCSDLAAFFNLANPLMKSQLESLSIVNVMPKIGPTKEQLEAFLKDPPSNISPKLWQEAILSNPDPDKLIPVPVYGFSGLAQRLNQIKAETAFHKSRMEQFRALLSQQQSGVTALENKISLISRKYKDLRHRLIKVKGKQDVCRLSGLPIQDFEVALRSRLETIKSDLNSNDQIQGLWKEIRAQKQLIDRRSKSNAIVAKDSAQSIPLEPTFVNEYKEYIARQQECLDYLVSTLKNDARDLEYIQNTFAKTFTYGDKMSVIP